MINALSRGPTKAYPNSHLWFKICIIQIPVEYSKWEIFFFKKKKTNNHEENVKLTRVKNSPICSYSSCWEHVFSHQGFHKQNRASRLGTFKLITESKGLYY